MVLEAVGGEVQEVILAREHRRPEEEPDDCVESAHAHAHAQELHLEEDQLAAARMRTTCWRIRTTCGSNMS